MVMVSTISAFDSLQGWRVLVLPNLIAIQSTSRLSFRKSQALRVKCDYSCFEARDVSYRPPGTELRLLNGVSFSLPEKSFGLIFGRSGSGKTTLLQLLAGLSNQPLVPFVFKSTVVMAILFGLLKFYRQKELALSSSFLRVRYFVADNVLDEVTFGWPRQKGDYQLKEHLALRLQRAINWVGLNGMSLDKDPYSLSGGYKRRLALAIQLVQTPDLLILDDPLAGLESCQH